MLAADAYAQVMLEGCTCICVDDLRDTATDTFLDSVTTNLSRDHSKMSDGGKFCCGHMQRHNAECVHWGCSPVTPVSSRLLQENLVGWFQLPLVQ